MADAVAKTGLRAMMMLNKHDRAQPGLYRQQVGAVCRRDKCIVYILLALAAGAVAALLFPVWLIASLLAVVVIVLGILLVFG